MEEVRRSKVWHGNNYVLTIKLRLRYWIKYQKIKLRFCSGPTVKVIKTFTITWVPDGGASYIVDGCWDLSLHYSRVKCQYDSLAFMTVVANKRHKDVLGKVWILDRYWLLVKLKNLGVGLGLDHPRIDEGNALATGNADFIVVSRVQLQSEKCDEPMTSLQFKRNKHAAVNIQSLSYGLTATGLPVPFSEMVIAVFAMTS